LLAAGAIVFGQLGQGPHAPGVAWAQEADRFLSAAEDVPLMPPLVETQSPVLFDSDAGRVSRTEASGAADPARVRAFYAETLPALGWRKEGEDRYVREAQRLSISIRLLNDGRPGDVLVAFTLVEAGAGAETADPSSSTAGDPSP
jgi:hypothetical protein